MHGTDYGRAYNKTHTMVASSLSFDPDVATRDSNDLAFSWFCRAKAEHFSMTPDGKVVRTVVPESGASSGGGCFGGGPGMMATTMGDFDFSTEFMMPTESFVFRVEVTKDTRWNYFEQDFYVGYADPPVVNVRCASWYLYTT